MISLRGYWHDTILMLIVEILVLLIHSAYPLALECPAWKKWKSGNPVSIVWVLVYYIRFGNQAVQVHDMKSITRYKVLWVITAWFSQMDKFTR
jgi:hypothetical protein